MPTEAPRQSGPVPVLWARLQPGATAGAQPQLAPVRASPISPSMKSVEARLSSSPRFSAASAVTIPSGVAPSGGLAR